MKLDDLLKKQGIETKKESGSIQKKSDSPRRRYFWDDDKTNSLEPVQKEQKEAPVIAKGSFVSNSSSKP